MPRGQNGGWRYFPKINGDTSVTTWMVQALKIGEGAGLKVPSWTWKELRGYLDSVADPKGGFGYTGPQATPRMTASGCLCRFLSGTTLKDDHLVKSIEILRKLPPTAKENNVYYYYHAAHVFYHVDPALRDAWSRQAWKVLLDKQEADGSWSDAGDPFMSASGRVMTVSLSLQMLELRYPQRLALAPLPPRELNVKELEAIWSDLGTTNVVQASESIRILAAAPGQSVAFLRDHLKPATLPEPAVLARLIAELDEPRFATRQKAEEQLEQLAELAVPVLEKVLTEKPALEVRSRVERLLRKAADASTSPACLQACRAIHALEHIATPDARQLLQSLADGAAGARTTQAATAAVQRLAKRP
jgi:hypothetical protein